MLKISKTKKEDASKTKKRLKDELQSLNKAEQRASEVTKEITKLENIQKEKEKLSKNVSTSIEEEKKSLIELNKKLSKTRVDSGKAVSELENIEKSIQSLRIQEENESQKLIQALGNLRDAETLIAKLKKETEVVSNEKINHEKAISLLESDEKAILVYIKKINEEKQKAIGLLSIEEEKLNAFTELSNKNQQLLKGREQRYKEEIMITREKHILVDNELENKKKELADFDIQMETRTHEIQKREVELQEQGRLVNNAKQELKKQWKRLKKDEKSQALDEFFR